MEDAQASLSTIPIELFYMIMGSLDPRVDLVVCGFVNKRWRGSSQHHIHPHRGAPDPVVDEHHSTNMRRFASRVARRGYLSVLQWARRNGCQWDERTTAAAAKGGHLDVLGWLRAHGCPWDPTSACAAAARRGHLDVLRWVADVGGDVDGRTLHLDSAFREAAKGGHLSILKWIHGRPGHVTTYAEPDGYGHPEVLEWMRGQPSFYQPRLEIVGAAKAGDLDRLIAVATKDNRPDTVFTVRVRMAAAAGGRLHVLKWLHENWPPSALGSGWCFLWPDGGSVAAAVDVLGWMLRHGVPHPCARKILDGAARRGELETLRWAKDHGFGMAYGSLLAAAVETGRVEVLEWLARENQAAYSRMAVTTAARKGHLAVLKWVERHWCFRADVALEAAKSGSVETLRYLLDEIHVPFDRGVVEQAARYGRLRLLTWLHSKYHGRFFGRTVCTAAAAGGHVAVLRWLMMDVRCFFDGLEMCTAAAVFGQLDALMWIVKHAGPVWSFSTVEEALMEGKVECARWAVEHGCPWNPSRCRRRARNRDPDALSLVEGFIVRQLQRNTV